MHPFVERTTDQRANVMFTTRITTVALIAVLLTACADLQDRTPSRAAGTLIGAGLGALAGSQVGSGKGQLAAVAIGALAGAWLGSETGKSLDKADRLYAERTAQNALEYNRTGQTSTWRNPDSGHAGTMTPTRTFLTDRGEDCREFETTVSIDGRMETATGRACRSV